MHIDITEHVDRPVDELIDLVNRIEFSLEVVRQSIRDGYFTEANSQAIVLGIYVQQLAEKYPSDRPLVAEPTANEAA